MAVILGLIGVLAASVACSSANDAASAEAISDGAGVAMLHISRGAIESAATLVLEEEIRLHW